MMKQADEKHDYKNKNLSIQCLIAYYQPSGDAAEKKAAEKMLADAFKGVGAAKPAAKKPAAKAPAAPKMSKKLGEEGEMDLAAMRKAAQGKKMTDEEKKARGLLYDKSIAS